MKLVIASANEGKIAEMRQLLDGHFDSVMSMREAGILEDIEETGDTLEQNALIKARFVRNRICDDDTAVLSDDTGLCVKALNNLPGVHTARFAGEHATHEQNRKHMLSVLNGVTDRTAYFQTVIVFIYPNGKTLFADGKTSGRILEEEQGERGFGYDSVFFSDELGKSFAQGSLEDKNRVSHRAKAIKNLLKQLQIT